MTTARAVLTLSHMSAVGHPSAMADQGCQWWNFACQGSSQIVDAGMSAITRSTAAGAGMVLGQIVKIVDGSTQVPLADPGYRHIYYGFLGLAAPLIGVILCVALVLCALRRDAGTLGRAVVGVVVAGLGGALYIGFAQLLVAVDNWLAHGIVRVTGHNLTEAITQLAAGFENIAGVQGDVAANMLLIVLMMIMLLAGLILWFVLVLRKIAILVVVAFAPLLIAGYLWAPTRGWSRKATEVLVALVFTKSAIFGLFGIGLALLSRGTAQSLSDFVGTVVLLCGACFAPLLMLRLVHFAADTHLAGDMMGTLRGGVQPVLGRMPHHGGGHSSQGRHEMARAQGQASPPPTPARATGLDASGPASASPAATGPSSAGQVSGSAGAAGAAGAASESGAAAGAAAGPAGIAAAGAAVAAQKTTEAARAAGQKLAGAADDLAAGPNQNPSEHGPVLQGPEQERQAPIDHETDRGDT